MYMCKKELNSCVIKSTYHIRASSTTSDHGPVRLSYNPYFLACFFSCNSVFLSQQINEQYFQPWFFSKANGAIVLTIVANEPVLQLAYQHQHGMVLTHPRFLPYR
jgi:hypothetical protein